MQNGSGKNWYFGLIGVILSFTCLAMLIVRIAAQDYIGAIGWLLGAYALAFLASDQAKTWRQKENDRP